MIARLKLTFGLCAAAVALVMASLAIGAALPRGLQLAYISTFWRPAIASAIMLIDIEHGLSVNLTPEIGERSLPVWSPDGTRLVFFERESPASHAISVLHLDDQRVVKLVENAYVDQQFAWTPDSRQVLYLGSYRDEFNLYVIDANGGEPAPFTPHERIDWSPVWSPDSTHMVYVSYQDGGGGEIYIADADRHSPLNAVRLTNNEHSETELAWSPDAQQLAYLSGDGAIYVMEIDGTNPRNVSQQVSSNFMPIWSPDGTRIAFESWHNGSRDLYLTSTDSPRPQRLTDHPAEDMQPAWSADGRYLVYTVWDSQRTAHLNLIDTATGQTRQLTPPDQHSASAVWRP